MRTPAKTIAVLVILIVVSTTFHVVRAQDPTPDTGRANEAQRAALERFDASRCYQAKAANTPRIKAPRTKQPPYRIAVSNSYIGNDWRVQMIQTVKAFANLPEIKPLISDLYVVSSGNDPDAQIAIVDMMIDERYDAIILDTASEDALNPAVQRAHDAGIVVISFDNVSSSPHAIRINEDQFEFGKVMAEWLVERLDGHGDVFMVTGVPGTTVDIGRTAGARSVFEQNPGITILGEQPGMWADVPAQTSMATALAAFRDLDGVWAQGGDTGVVKAFIDVRRKFVPIAGEAENGFRKLAAAREIPIISVAQSPAMAAVSVKLAIDMLKDGIEVPQDINIPLQIVRGEEMVEGRDYFPGVKDSFFADFQLPDCGVMLTVDEILAQEPF